ncbi:MAG TPA: hypothetical protein VHJ20_09725 [Polyangia bacterium]|nr:hypothetical protein [Polyangia bacterium]
MGFVAAALLLGACSSGGDSGNTGGTTGSTGGTTGSTGGTTGSTGGTTGSTGGTTGSTGGTTGSTGGTTGSTGGTTGSTGGTTGSSGGTTGSNGGTTGGNGGSGGTAAGGTGGTTSTGPKLSAGCGMAPGSSDSQSNFVLKNIMVTGVDTAFVSAHPPSNTSYTWTMRNYGIRLPKSYNPNSPYALDLEGTGCGGNDTVGKGGDFALPSTGATQMEAIQIGLSYLPSNSINTCATFADGYSNSPEPAYMRAIINEIEANYCVDMNKVFVNGYSSGAWMAALSGCTNADQVRAFGVQVGGGLRTRPPCMNKPVAAMFVVGLADTGNPIGPLKTAQNDSFGSVGLRDEILKRNGCVAQDFQIVDTCSANGGTCAAGIQIGDTYSNVPNAVWNDTYSKCHMYTGCPAKYPVVWCPLNVNHGNGQTPMGGDSALIENYRRTAMWQFFSSLPPE